MTRINCVPPEELTRQHLIAEYRELPRIFGLVRAAIERGEKPTDRRNPVAYTLGTIDALTINVPVEWLGGWKPTPEALALNRARIEERLGNGLRGS